MDPSRKRHGLGKKDVQDNSQARHTTARNKGKELIVLDNVHTLANDELSSNSSPDLSPTKSCRARSRQRHSHCPAFSNADSGTFYRARRETSRGLNQQNGVPGNTFALPTSVMPLMPPMYPAFDTRPTLYILHATTIRSPTTCSPCP